MLKKSNKGMKEEEDDEEEQLSDSLSSQLNHMSCVFGASFDLPLARCVFLFCVFQVVWKNRNLISILSGAICKSLCRMSGSCVLHLPQYALNFKNSTLQLKYFLFVHLHSTQRYDIMPNLCLQTSSFFPTLTA